MAIDAALSLQEMVPYDMLTPMFFALGPTVAEIKAKQYYSPFGDIMLWENLLKNGRIKPETIREALQKKGYCKDDKLISAG